MLCEFVVICHNIDTAIVYFDDYNKDKAILMIIIMLTTMTTIILMMMSVTLDDNASFHLHYDMV